MTSEGYGLGSRQPVFSGSRRVPGLYQRSLADGRLVFEVRQRLGGSKLRRVRLEATTKSDAIVEQRALMVDLERGQQHLSPAVALCLNDLAQDWLRDLESRTSHRDPRLRRSPRTIAVNRQRLQTWVLPLIGHKCPDELTVRDLRELIERMTKAGRAPSTISGTVTVLSGLLRFAMKHGFASRNVVQDLDRDDRPGTARLSEPRYLTVEQVESLLTRLSDTFRPVAALCAFAGLRASEALGLRWCDIDFGADTLTVSGQLGLDGKRIATKTAASAAMLPLLPALKRILLEHRRDVVARKGLASVRSDRLVCVTRSGSPQFRRNALRAIHAAGDAANLNAAGRPPVGLHDLRHSFVAIALENGLTLPEAALLARHANPRVTAVVYAGVADGARERATAKLLSAGFGA
jgi:integrase